MNRELNETAKAWLEEATVLSRLCLERRAVMEDRMPRFSAPDQEDVDKLEKQYADLDGKIAASSVRLKHLEDESDECVGLRALNLGDDVEMPIRNVVAVLTVCGIRELFADMTRSVGQLVEIAAGDDAESAITVRQSLTNGGVLRPMVTYREDPVVIECGDPALTESAFRHVLGLPSACAEAVAPVRRRYR